MGPDVQPFAHDTCLAHLNRPKAIVPIRLAQPAHDVFPTHRNPYSQALIS